ncbi:carbohydrate ABC transporter permease [Chelatococcus asaccharovorans]|uniref:Carbohydrate ABC transporter membrane protein 1 (CUT1 family) n=1 Tax=Chelatococcus asaccharovorans TaxID=28210 RepID=A0A2V3TV84_9HYPH|nr:sugar ABC transporter permease [Chelatococcus asaccharovorans]MBS7702036.1 sugar ABC transporter permease [Chelatococcus asaccharovorans]PXW52806.1 carbohydrate ABC transporter membrane protein 1 (CUT1 family) [Chelatococcus asaccharovorans]CAH1667311.1 Carbohydrate ABC transporter membrane protein 1 (CUT1 family) [Chelatococcus asaccharovorans]CAH1681025.1 Carbohydrate ABC transporter membrane protein 1 (CUT1 family) [Chelatococcus asaccharovorans]
MSVSPASVLRPITMPRVGFAPLVAPYVLVAPLLGLIFIFAILPAALALFLTFFETDILAGTMRFVGTANFARAADRGNVLNSLRVTFLYTVLTVPPSMILGLSIALAINGLRRGRMFWQAVYFLPVAATLVAMSIVWRWMFVGRKGIIDQTFGQAIGLTDWLNSPVLSLPAVAIVGNWQQIGFVVILYLAALTAVPRHLLEAARVDGAGAWSRFWHVTWPSIGPTTVFVGIITSVDALRVFDTISTMTGGGPSRSSQTLAHLMWERGIYFFDIGGGSVVTLVLLALALAATAVQRLLTARLERAGTR